MKNRNWRIGGIYDKSILDWCNAHQIRQIQFDLRPTSPSFVQFYIVQDLISHLSETSDHKIIFNFQNEKEASINYLLEEVKKSRPHWERSLLLFFTDQREVGFYKNFKYPQAIEIDNLEFVKKVLENSQLEELIIPYHSLEFLSGRGELPNFLSELFNIQSKNNIKLGVHLDWDSDIISSIFDFYTFDFFTLSVSRKVENGYRQFDSTAASSCFNNLKKQLGQN